jgi:histidine phosphotransfer protein HptB
MAEELVEWQEYGKARKELGEAFARILGYFREDGIRSVDAIEQAMRDRDAAALVIPAHTLKGESRQFGARQIGDMAEKIELTARRCVEDRDGPEELVEIIADLRDCFSRTLEVLEDGVSPLVAKKQVAFGRRQAGSVTLFGRD